MHPQSLPWIEPLALAAAIGEPYWALLHSGVKTAYSGRYSLLACDLAARAEGEDFSVLEAALSADAAPFANAWFGYLGYGLKDCLEASAPAARGWITLPNLCMMRFKSIYHFDHEQQQTTLWSQAPRPLPAASGVPDHVPPVASLRSNMSRDEYLAKAAHIIERIRAGDLYQANLTRKFMGEFADAPDGFALFRKLCAASPAPYSAFLRLGEASVISSSPECFLEADAAGRMVARPIKGTAPRFADAARDRASREALAASAKDRAENLMIVDLMRNDLSRSCIPGSVGVEALFDLTTHATIHHLSSTVTGRRAPQCSTLGAVKHCFPPGSMTGAPKIRAMRLCAEMESYPRGVYSGAIGWFGGDGSCQLSVAIRTLILQGSRFEFQVGGGIVSDSTPEQELQETYDKASGLLAALNLPPSALASL